jgi:hypothetical protein
VGHPASVEYRAVRDPMPGDAVGPGARREAHGHQVRRDALHVRTDLLPTAAPLPSRPRPHAHARTCAHTDARTRGHTPTHPHTHTRTHTLTHARTLTRRADRYMDAHAVPSAGDWALDRNGAIFLQGAWVRQCTAYRRAARTHARTSQHAICACAATSLRTLCNAVQRSAAQRSAMQCNGRDAWRDDPHHICTGTGTQLSGGRDRARAVRLVCVRPARWQRRDGLRARKPLPLSPYPLYPLIPLYPEALNARTACPHLASFLATAAGSERACTKQTRSADT